MAVTQNSYTGNASTTTYSFTFPYLKTSEIKASLDGTVTTAFSTPTATTVQFNTAPGSGVKIKIYRETDTDSLAATFYAGSSIKSQDLNDNFTQNLYTTQEVSDRYVSKLGGSVMEGDLTFGKDTKLIFEGATDDAHETTLTVADPTADRTITLPNVTGTVVTTGDTGTVARAMIAADAINGTKIADDSVDSEHIAADSLDTEHYAPNSVDTTALAADAVTGAQIADNAINSEHYVDGSIDREHLAADIVDGTKIADDSINSEHYVDGSIDTAHIADAQITHVKLANDCIDGDNIQNDVINSEHYAAGSIDTEHIADSQVTTAKIASDAITGAKIADDSIDSEHYVADSIDTEHYAPNSVDADALAHTSVTAGTYTATDLTVDAQGRITAASNGTIATSEIADDAVTGSKIAHATIDSENYAHGSVDHVHLANDVIDGDNIQDDVVNSEHIAAGALDNEHYAAGSIDSGKLSAATIVTNSEQAAASVNDTSFFTTSASDARYFNISSGDTIKDGVTFPDNDTTIATTAAINDRIVDLVDDVGGFVPIANETSFPTANPDVNNGAGTLVSIKALASNLTSNGSGVATIANGAGSGNTVTITGLANSTTYAATFGLIVETTSTLHTYAFHRQVPKATEVTTVAGSITNVNTVAGDISNVNAVAGNATNINAVAGNASNINSAVSNASNINSAVSNASNINAAVSNATNINTVAGANSNITTVAGSISNVNTVATNITDVSNFADLYQISTSAPTQDGGGNSLSNGDLWFDSSSNKALMIYDGSSGDGFSAATPTASVLQDIAIVSGQITFSEDLGSIGDSLTTGTGNNINTVASSISNVNTVAGISSNVTTVAGISSNVTTVAGAVSNINTTVSNLASINNFAEVYRIASGAPSSSLHEGDLWYDSTNNVLKYYNGTNWTVTAAAGLSDLIDDTSPELGGHLDCNNKNLTEVGTVSGDNLQIDFGTLS